MDFIELAKVCAPEVHTTTMVAIVRHESAFNPLAIGVNEKPHRSIKSKTREEAVQTVKKLLEQGKNFDAGYGQINSANWEWLGITPENVFDPCTNLQAAQRVLVNCYNGASKKLAAEKALYAALSCYNTGNYQNGFTNGYVDKVVAGVGSAPKVTVPALAKPSRGHRGKVTEQSDDTPRKLDNAEEPTPAQSSQSAFNRTQRSAFKAQGVGQFTDPFQARAQVGSIVYRGRP
ncbi:hypothetical protein CSC67_07880 [Pusillimonas caeni]|nr:hypothetical protein CSC67_07880 [Pusillimonas caeni]